LTLFVSDEFIHHHLYMIADIVTVQTNHLGQVSATSNIQNASLGKASFFATVRRLGCKPVTVDVLC